MIGIIIFLFVENKQLIRKLFCDLLYFKHLDLYYEYLNAKGGQMGRAFAPSAEDRGYESLVGQDKDWNIGTCCFPGKRSPFKA